MVLLHVRSSDIFGLFSIPCSRPEPLELVALPRLYAGLDEQTRCALNEDDDRRAKRKGDAGELLAESREYRPGDTLRSIHWQQSASRRKLLTRLREESVDPVCVLLVDTKPYIAGDEEDALAYEDAMCECAYSVLFAQSSLRRRVTLMPCGLERAGEVPDAAEMLSRLSFAESADTQVLRELLLGRIPDALIHISCDDYEGGHENEELLSLLALQGCRVTRLCPRAYFSDALARVGVLPVSLEALAEREVTYAR